MKVTINVDCTPEEARTFMGLPDVKPMQEAAMQQMQEKMQAAVDQFDPNTMVQNWFSTSQQSFEQFQKMFGMGAGQGQ